MRNYVLIFVNRFLDIITKQKRISDAATQQLLLDNHILKTTLLQLPVLGLDGDSSEVNINQGIVGNM